MSFLAEMLTRLRGPAPQPVQEPEEPERESLEGLEVHEGNTQADWQLWHDSCMQHFQDLPIK